MTGQLVRKVVLGWHRDVLNRHKDARSIFSMHSRNFGDDEERPSFSNKSTVSEEFHSACSCFAPSKDTSRHSVSVKKDSSLFNALGVNCATQGPVASMVCNLDKGRGLMALSDGMRTQHSQHWPSFHKMQRPAQFWVPVRFSSTASGERLEDDLGSFSEGESGAASDFGEGFAVSNVEAMQKGSEVIGIIGDCSYPTAFLQLLIENVHLYAGLPWWASIAVVTIAIRMSVLPLIAYQLRSTTKLTLLRPELEIINKEIKESNYDPRITLDAHNQMKEILKRHNVNPLAAFVGVLVQAPIFICFFFAVRNMAQRMESFKDGGFLWFTDLSTADSTYILPLLTTLSLFVTVELGATEGLEGNPMAAKMKNYMRVFAAITFPLTLFFEKGIFCYWITSNCWSICQTIFLKNPAVKSFFGIPTIVHSAHQQSSPSKPVEVIPDPVEVIADPVMEPVKDLVKPSRRTPRPMNSQHWRKTSNNSTRK